MLAAVFDLFLTGVHSPLIISPSCNDLQIGCKCFDTKFKTDLVITFTCCTVADCCSTFLTSDLYKSLCDTGTSHGCSKQVFIFIYCVSHNTGNDVFITEDICNILDIELFSTTSFGSFFQAIQFVTLTTVNADTDYFIIKVFL